MSKKELTMGKYEPLARYLEQLPGDSWDARFAEVEKVLGFPLPSSAHQYPAWWANQDGPHSQTKGWRDAGWETNKVDLPAKRVRFVRRRHDSNPRNPRSDNAADDLEQLVERAAALTGIQDRALLLRHALETTIRQEAAKQLIALGGSDPEAKAPPRRRFW